MANKTINLTREVYDYLLANSLRESDVLKQLRQETLQQSMSIMQISPDQGQLMALLVKLINAKKTLEIGVFTGYSSLVVAAALPADGKVIACDINKEWTDIAERFWELAGVRHKIDLRLGPAVATLEQLIAQGESNTFDFIFIDANKKQYDIYYEKSLQLLRSKGLMMIDNVLQQGDVADVTVTDSIVQAIRELNQKILQDQRVDISMLPVSDGITLICKR